MCIESIRRHTQLGSYEIIVVDNGSEDGSVKWLREQLDIRLIVNKENKGFPGGCNQGLRVARGEELLLLNSDTVVTPRWLIQLKLALYSDARIGAVSCMANTCAEVQRISVPYGNDMNAMTIFADGYNHSDPTMWQRRIVLMGFCYLFRREVYEQVGGLDEAMSPGNFEDDDYSLRIRAAGWKLLLCRDTFIHHFGSVSFLQSGNQAEYQKKMSRLQQLSWKNREYLLTKWHLTAKYRTELPFIRRIEFSKPAPHILLLDCGASEDAYTLQLRYPLAKIFAVTGCFADAMALAPDFPAKYCPDIGNNVFDELNGEYDAIVCCTALDSYQDRGIFLGKLGEHLTIGGKVLYLLEGTLRMHENEICEMR